MRADSLLGELASWLGLALASTILGMLLLVGSARAEPIIPDGLTLLAEFRYTDTDPDVAADPPWAGWFFYGAGDFDRCVWTEIDRTGQDPPFPTSRGTGPCTATFRDFVSHGEFSSGGVRFDGWKLYNVPEPSPLALLGLGLLALWRRR